MSRTQTEADFFFSSRNFSLFLLVFRTRQCRLLLNHTSRRLLPWLRRTAESYLSSRSKNLKAAVDKTDTVLFVKVFTVSLSDPSSFRDVFPDDFILTEPLTGSLEAPDGTVRSEFHPSRWQLTPT